MPPAFQDEGYGHGVSIDSMIVTPRVPILGEQLPNVGTNMDAGPSEFPQSNNSLDLLRRAVMSIEKELEDQALEGASLSTLAADRQQRITMLESLLEREKVINNELHQSLSKANDELLCLKKENDVYDLNYKEALEKIKEFKALYQQSEDKVKEIRAKLACEQATLSTTEGLLWKKNEEIRMAESFLKDQFAEVDAPKAKIAKLEKVNALKAKITFL